MTENVCGIVQLHGAALPAELASLLPGVVAAGETWFSLAGAEQAAVGAWRVLFSGRLWNRVELAGRVGLPADCGCAELLCRLLVERGTAAIAEFNGPFVAVMMQEEPRRLILARDQHGQRFLYYASRADGVVLVSDSLAWLRRCPGVDTAVDMAALGDYLSLGYVPAPRSMYRGVRKVPAGAMVTWADGGAERVKRYWWPQMTAPGRMSYGDAVEETRRLLGQALERCLLAAPAAGVLLSGGIDSSLVLGLAAPRCAGAIRTYTIGFEHGQYDERRLAAQAAAMAGAQHAERLATPADLSLLPGLLAASGEPFADSSLVPTAVAMRFAAVGGSHAVLMGDGGDELFGGYRRYQVMAMRERLGIVPRGLVRGLSRCVLACLPEHAEQRTVLSSLRRLAAAWALEALPCYASFQEIFSPALRQELAAADDLRAVPSYLAGWSEEISASGLRDLVEQMNYLDLLHYVPDDGCRKDLLAEQGTGVEALAPILDMDVTRFALQLPRAYRVTCRERKRLLRSVGEGIIPPDLLRQTKRGFGVPVASWLRGELAGAMREMAADLRRWDSDGWFAGAVVDRYVREHLAGVRDHGAKLWVLYCLKLWREQ